MFAGWQYTCVTNKSAGFYPSISAQLMVKKTTAATQLAPDDSWGRFKFYLEQTIGFGMEACF